MTQIYYDRNSVKSTVESLKSEYDQLIEKVKEMNQKKAQLTSFWDATEAERFSEQLDNVSNMLTEFQGKYDNYLKLIDSVTESYQKDEDEFVGAIEKAAQNK